MEPCHGCAFEDRGALRKRHEKKAVQQVGTLDGARDAMAKGEIDVWLWEKFTTKHLVDSGAACFRSPLNACSKEWDIVGEAAGC